MEVQKFDASGKRIATPVNQGIKSNEEYLMLEKTLAQLLCNGDVHYWGGFARGNWVQSEGDMQVYDAWMRSSEAITKLIVEYDVYAVPYPIEHSTSYEGRYYHGGRFHSVFVPYNEHHNKTLAYRYAILLSVIDKLKRIAATTVLEPPRNQLPNHV